MDDENNDQLNLKKESLLAMNMAKLHYEVVAADVIREKLKLIELNKSLQEEIGKFQRNGNLGFYIFLSTTMACIVYLLSK